MAGTRSQNTQAEGLMAMLGQLGQLKAAPDADIETISGIESQILEIIKRPQQQALQQLAQAGGVVPPDMAGPGPAGPMGGPPPGPDMGMGPGGATATPGDGMLGGTQIHAGPGGPSPAAGGAIRSNPMPPIDQLRNLLQAPPRLREATRG